MLKEDFEKQINIQKENLNQLKGLVGIKFTDAANLRIENQVKQLEELMGIKRHADIEQSRYTSPLSNHYFQQIFFK